MDFHAMEFYYGFLYKINENNICPWTPLSEIIGVIK